MGALQQGRAIFNPLPLGNRQNPDLVPQIQGLAKAAYSKLITLSRPDTAADQSKTQESHWVKLEGLISTLNLHKTQELIWNRNLEQQTSQYWNSQIKERKFL